MPVGKYRRTCNSEGSHQFGLNAFFGGNHAGDRHC
jgi:hypothetical protein